MTRPLTWLDCALAGAILLPVVALILAGRAVGIAALVIWECITEDYRRD